MKPILCMLVAIGLSGAAPAARASCRWFGTQLDCDLGVRQLSIGTQTAAEPARVGGFRPLALRGGNALFDEHPVVGPLLRLEIQNVGADPGACWRFGNETYCH